MYSFSVWVDADSFPALARKFLAEHALGKGVEVLFVANHELKVPDERVKMIVCEKVEGAADDYICNHACENDIVVTRDIPFASRLVQKNIAVMNDRGLLFSKESIEDKLRERDFSLNLAELGLGGKKENFYGEKELKKFSALFIEELQKHIIADIYHVKRR